uniref:Protein kinase domain-containing protein n=1 Tax=Steinernema glaseri TaxID=37863 RepID=A0A1I7Z6S8_9BILA
MSLSVHEYPDMFQVVLHGYPLDDVNVSITRLADNRSESHHVSTLQMIYFDGSLGVISEAAHSSFFVSYFSVKLRECAVCEHRHVAGDYALRFCAPSSCVEAVVFLAYPKHPVAIAPSPPSEGVRVKPLHPLLNVGIGALAFLSVGLCALLAFVFAKRRLVKKGWEIRRRISRAPTDRTDETSIRLEDTSSAAYSSSGYIVRQVPEIERGDLQLREKLGQGAYGEVYAAEWAGTRSAPSLKVAVKTLRGDMAFDAEMDAEAAMLSRLDHQNVVRLYGMCRASESAPAMLVFELMNLGDLKTYLRERQPRAADYSQFPPALNVSELNNIVLQVATGLAYIHSQQIVHRDLAARNCLIGGESDLRVCEAAFRPSVTVKISDFGMSRRLYSQSQYYRMGSQTMLPVRWLPPECLNDGRFSHQSDMWSFGLTVWEIYSFGRLPFGDLSNNEVLSAVCSGIRPSRPSACPQEMFEVMQDCWKSAPSERISSAEALSRVTMAQ